MNEERKKAFQEKIREMILAEESLSGAKLSVEVLAILDSSFKISIEMMAAVFDLTKKDSA